MAIDSTYILDENGNPVPEPDLERWAAWMDANGEHRRVARDCICGGSTDIVVSTMFQGFDHTYMDDNYPSFNSDGAPLLFETLVFGGTKDGAMRRCSTQAEALINHVEVVEEVKGSLVAGRMSVVIDTIMRDRSGRFQFRGRYVDKGTVVAALVSAVASIGGEVIWPVAAQEKTH